jgi:TonB family protein
MRQKRLYFFAVFLLMLPMLSLTVVWQMGQMQQAKFSLADILTGLRSKKATLADKNRILTDAVKQRGITFTLSAEIESELRNTGASDELIEAIRQKSSKPPVISTPKPTPTATPTPSPPPPDSVFYRKRGDDYTVKGEYDLAILDYDEAIRLNPKDAIAFYKRGFAFHYKNNHDRAYENYKTAIQLENEFALQPMLQCALYNSTKNDNPDKAIEECSKTINSGSDFALAYYIRGNAYQNKKDADRAIADYSKFIKSNPKNILVYINRGDVYFDKKDYDLAAADYNEAIKLDAGNELAKRNLQRLQAEILNAAANKPESSASSGQPKLPQIPDVGALNSRAIRLSAPLYPANARKFRVGGNVTVQVTIDENGNVTSAKATSGNGLLRASAEDAARKSKFKPVTVGNQTVKATGSVVYNFILP